MKLKLNRWIYAAVGVIVLLFAGLVYAWSVLASPIAAEFTQWSQAQLSLTFTICMTLFCLGGFVGGLLSGKINVKIKVWAAAVLFFTAFLWLPGNITDWPLYRVWRFRRLCLRTGL